MRDLNRNIGSFMVAVGAIIELKGTKKILLNKRTNHEVHEGEWEMVYGRIGHHEELTTALKREIQEETGIQNLEIKKMSRVWHIYRGKKHKDTEVYGFTFVCETNQEKIIISDEHSEYKWVEPEEALKMVKVPGIKKDLEVYLESKDQKTNILISDLENNTEIY